MALSMFLRNSVCASNVWRPQLARLSSQLVAQKIVTPLSVTSLNIKVSQTPIFNAVRSFSSTKSVCAENIPRPPVEMPHDHSKLWVVEKGVNVLLAVVLPVGLMMPNKILDCVLSLLIVVHSFWGLEAIAVDYVRAAIFGPLIPKLAIAFVYLISIATLGGLFYIITHDIGVANTIKQLWAIKAQKDH